MKPQLVVSQLLTNVLVGPGRDPGFVVLRVENVGDSHIELELSPAQTHELVGALRAMQTFTPWPENP